MSRFKKKGKKGGEKRAIQLQHRRLSEENVFKRCISRQLDMSVQKTNKAKLTCQRDKL